MRWHVFAGTPIAGLVPASVVETAPLSTTSEVTLDNGTVVTPRNATFDPETGAFSRRGQARRPNGGIFTYSVSGSCESKARKCEFTGSAEGPLGGTWTFEGGVARSASGGEMTISAKGTLGQSINVRRTISRDSPLIKPLQGSDGR